MLTSYVGLVPMAVDANPAPIAFYGLIGLAFWLFVLSVADILLSRFTILDDILRVVIVVLGVGGVIIAIPFVGILGSLFQQLITFGIEKIPSIEDGGTAAQVISIAVFVAIAYFAVRWYINGRRNNRSTKPDVEQISMKLRTLVLVLAFTPIYGIEVVKQATTWILNPFGIIGWNGLVGVYKAFSTWTPTF